MEPGPGSSLSPARTGCHPADHPDRDPRRPWEATSQATETGDATYFSFETTKFGTDLLPGTRG